MTPYWPKSLYRLPLFVLIVLAAVTGFAAPDPVANMHPSASAIQWTPSVDNEKITLVVIAPDGTTFTKDFTTGNLPQFRVQDLTAGDGAYLYELRVTPRVTASVKQQLAAARAANDAGAVQRIQHANGLDRAVTQSGTLTVLNGAFINSDAVEPGANGKASTVGATTSATHSSSSSTTSRPGVRPTTADVVTADDEIIQGSLCVGLDCVVNESFGFDTVRLKENNTRIHFQDTSTGTGFPNVNWQLTANDSASGGANKFSVDDLTNTKTPFTITAAAPTNSIFVASSGKVGFGNASPGLNLHITATDTPAIRMEQTSGGGFTAQTWDVAGNEANWFVRDLTGGSRLPLRIRPGAPTSSVDIAATGFVGIGTATPGRQLNVGNGTADTYVRIQALNRTYDIGSGANASGDGKFAIYDVNTSTFRFVIDGNGKIGINTPSPTNAIDTATGAFLTTGGVWTNASSRSYKDNICDLDEKVAMDTVKNLNPVTFTYKVDPEEHHVGFIAEDVPDLVATKNRKALSAMDVVAVLTKVVQEQQKTIEDLNKRLGDLEKKN
jgi:hypothetical protein